MHSSVESRGYCIIYFFFYRYSGGVKGGGKPPLTPYEINRKKVVVGNNEVWYYGNILVRVHFRVLLVQNAVHSVSGKISAK